MTSFDTHAAASGALLAWLVSAGLAGTAAAQSTPPPAAPWVGSWGADPALPNGPEVTNQTIRQVVRLSMGGNSVRIRISNELGTAPLVIGAAHLARPGQEAGSIDPATDRLLTFGGRPSVTLPPGAPVVSDPVALDTKALDRLTISLFVPRDTGPTATHPLGRATAFLADGGDMTMAATLSNPTTSSARFSPSAASMCRPPEARRS